jgi:hypothetical protein
VDWTPQILFAVFAVATVVAQGRYMDALARNGGQVAPDSEVGIELRTHPGRLLPVVVSETRRRLRALVTRQSDPALERPRLVACAFIVLAIAAFVWSVIRTVG